LKMVDECGNMWDCTFIYGRRPNFKTGGGLKRMILARWLH